MRAGCAFVALAAMSLLVPAYASAETVFRPKDGVYIGLALPFVTIGNDFDGETFFVGDTDVVLVPKLDSAFGLRVSLGVRFSNVAMELNYLRSSHDASVAGIPAEAKYQQFGGDLKFLLTQQQAQPYLLVGMYLPEVILKDGSASVFGDVGDASYQGLGLNAGVGLLYNLHPRFSFDIGVVYRLGLFASAKGASGTRETLDEALIGGGIGVNLGGSFTF
jgi:hypothetical protein